ncbi:MAG TPA: VOC family protein [Bauldia sp.]|nr:VOC family protein [Bauldia sp.]
MPAATAFDDRIVFQVAFVTNDIEKTKAWCAEFFGIAPPPTIVTDARDRAETEYLGAPSGARAKLAFFEFGNTTLELIEPDGEPSCWREFLDRNGPGFHHFAFKIRGMKEKIATFAQAGIPLLQSGEFTGGRYAYIDTEPHLGALIELLEFDNEIEAPAKSVNP